MKAKYNAATDGMIKIKLLKVFPENDKINTCKYLMCTCIQHTCMLFYNYLQYYICISLNESKKISTLQSKVNETKESGDLLFK